jgi:hypothetical protein
MKSSYNDVIDIPNFPGQQPRHTATAIAADAQDFDAALPEVSYDDMIDVAEHDLSQSAEIEEAQFVKPSFSQDFNQRSPATAAASQDVNQSPPAPAADCILQEVEWWFFLAQMLATNAKEAKGNSHTLYSFFLSILNPLVLIPSAYLQTISTLQTTGADNFALMYTFTRINLSAGINNNPTDTLPFNLVSNDHQAKASPKPRPKEKRKRKIKENKNHTKRKRRHDHTPANLAQAVARARKLPTSRPSLLLEEKLARDA